MEGLLMALAVFLLLNLAVMVIFFVRSAAKYGRIENRFEEFGKYQTRIEQAVKEEIARNRDETSKAASQNREELVGTLKLFEDSVQKRLVDSLDMMSQQLESVNKGLGEMQSLASSVGDLKKVLTNVKTRGILGEVQLGMLLEQILAPEQYEANVVTKKGSNERVEYAVKLPGRDREEKTPVWLPIDAKFPQEDYQRLLQAQDEANPELVERAARQLEIRIKAEAKDIKEKYIDPPHTTDFAILFLPTEGLFAEVLRRPGLNDAVQRDCRVMIAGPTILAALLNSLQMGFRTLAIEKHASQVWQLLGVVKTEFAKFGDILDRTKKKLQETLNIVEDASSKTRTIQRKLRKVEQLPSLDEASSVKELSTD